MTTYEDLVAATLPLRPRPAGGAAAQDHHPRRRRDGARHRVDLVPQRHAARVGARDGRAHRAGRDRHGEAPSGPRDLFRGVPNSYGTLGYATRLKIELEPVAPYVALRHLRFRDLRELVATMARIVSDANTTASRSTTSTASCSAPTRATSRSGRQTDEPGPVSDYTGMEIYYRSIQHRSADRLTIHDYLWRWDTDWFWCSRAFGAQNPKIRRLWPRRYRRSSVYWKIMALDRRYDVADRIEARKGNPPQRTGRPGHRGPDRATAEFLELVPGRSSDRADVAVPVAAARTRAAGRRRHPAWPLYPLEPKRTYVNVGFWSSVPTVAGRRKGRRNRAIERKVTEFDGHKSLYSDSYYPAEEFAALYGGAEYARTQT